MNVRLALAAAPAALALAAGSAHGAGFYIQEQSVTGLGRAFAGEQAIGEDASTVYFNPAAMTELKGAEVQGGVHLLVPRAKVKDRGSRLTVRGTNLGPIGGNDGGNPYEPTPVPNFHAALPLADGRLWLGFSATAPFGLASDYGQRWFGRYDSTETELKTYNFQPSIAYKLTDRLSVGGGIDIQYVDVTLESAIPLTRTADAIGRVEGDDLSAGINLGILYKPFDGTRVGLHYRSGVHHTIEGEQTVTSPLAPTQRRGGRAELDLPDIVALGLAQQVTPQLTLLGSVTWFNWSTFDEIFVNTGSPTDREVRQNYVDTWAFSVGAQYKVTDAVTVRAGFQYDPTPTQDNFRTTRTPDGDRYWLAAGLTYSFGRLSVDAAYAHIFVNSEDINLVRPGPTGLTAVYNAETENAVDIFSIALRYRF
ncbi:MAG TPA: outer membrane protein transport protein [Azospirillaceae bacterium]|nr:outer membrane protein transport protein [Azospirillaceae bacterium]